MPMQHTNFQIDGVNYLLEASCRPQVWPRLIDRVHKNLERIGKKSAADMCGHTAKACCQTSLNKVLYTFYVTVNPKGLNLEITRPPRSS